MWNAKIRELQSGDPVSMRLASTMEFRKLQSVQLSRTHICRILNGKPGESDPKKRPFDYHFSSDKINQAYIKVGFTPATWKDMEAPGVRHVLKGTACAKQAAKIHARHLSAAAECRAQGYSIEHMVKKKVEFQDPLAHVTTFQERIQQAAALKITGVQCLLLLQYF